MIGDYFSLAFKNLKHRGLRSWLTMLGIFIGIAAVVSLISLGQGLQDAVTGQFSDLAPDRLIVQNAETGFGPPGALAIRKLTEHDLKIVEGVDHVELVLTRLIRTVNVEFNKASIMTYLGSMPEDEEKAEFIYSSFNVETEEGRLLRPEDKGKIVLGNDFIYYDRFGKRIRAGSTMSIQGRDFEVVGILKKTSTFTLNSVVLMNEEDMKDLLEIGDEIDLIIVQVDDVKNMEKVAKDISDELREDRNLDVGKEDFTVQTPEQLIQSVNTILNVVNLVVIGIATISLLVGGIGIANTMYTSVLERRKEIGVMKAIGARKRDIVGIFIIEAGLLGLAGGLIGAFIGLGLAEGVSLIARSFLPGLNLGVKISWPLLAMAVSFSFVIGILSGFLPALQASKLNPVEALRS